MPALSASSVGTWEYDLVAGLIFLDPLLAPLFGFSTSQGAGGLPIARVRTRMRAADRTRGGAMQRSVQRDGSIFMYEFVTRPGNNIEHRLLGRGRFETNGSGKPIYARGIIIDITNVADSTSSDGFAALVAPADDPQASALDVLADHVLAAREIIAKLGLPQPSTLAMLNEVMLLEIGRMLARQMQASNV